MKFFMLISLKLLTIANSFLVNLAEHKISLLINMKMPTFVELSIKLFYNLGARESLSESCSICGFSKLLDIFREVTMKRFSIHGQGDHRGCHLSPTTFANLKALLPKMLHTQLAKRILSELDNSPI